jgi:hypothetical protein
MKVRNEFPARARRQLVVQHPDTRADVEESVRTYLALP